MAISTQISRLMSLRDAIRTKMISLGILPAASSSATLSQCYDALSGVTALGAMSYTPTTAAQTIPSGRYLSGVQTIEAIPSAYIIPTGTSTITSNGLVDISSYSAALVNVQPALQSKTVTPTTLPQFVVPDPDVYGLSRVTVNAIPSAYIIPAGTITLSENGMFDVASYASANVTVAGAPSVTYIEFSSSHAILHNTGSIISNGLFAYYSSSTIPFVEDKENVLAIEENAFFSAYTAGSDVLSYDNCSFIGSSAFAHISDPVHHAKYMGSLTISFPALEAVNTYAFCEFDFGSYYLLSHRYYSSIYMPYVTSIGGMAFAVTKAITILQSGTTVSMSFGSRGFVTNGIRIANIPNLETVGNYAFAGNQLLSYITCQSTLKTISIGAFAGCINLKFLDFIFDSLTSIQSYAFTGCANLQELNAPNLLSITSDSIFTRGYFGTNSSYNCNIHSFIASKLSTITGKNVFGGAINLTTVSCYSLGTITGTGVFSNCYALTSFYAPNLTSLNAGYIFASCSALSLLYLSNLSYASGQYMFACCRDLSSISFPKASRLSGNAMFRSCFNLVSIFLTGSSVCALGNTIASMFYSTPVSTYSTSAGRFASIFVPSSLLASYKAATNWATISGKIFAYEDYFDSNGNPRT